MSCFPSCTPSLPQASYFHNHKFLILYQYELVEPGTIPKADAQDSSKTSEEKEISKTQAEKDKKRKAKARITVQHLNTLEDEFWLRRPWLLSNKPGKIPKEL